MCKLHQLLWLIATRGSESQRHWWLIVQFPGLSWRTQVLKLVISVHVREMTFEMVLSVSLRGFIWSSTPTITLEMKLDDGFFVTRSLYLKDSKKLLHHLKIILCSKSQIIRPLNPKNKWTVRFVKDPLQCRADCSYPIICSLGCLTDLWNQIKHQSPDLILIFQC